MGGTPQESSQRTVQVPDIVKNPVDRGYWCLKAALYGLREGARNWYDHN